MNKKILNFLFLCIPSRLLLALIAKVIDPVYLPFMAILTIFISIGFFINFIKYKKNSKGFFGGKVWWNNYRLVHSFCYALFSVLASLKYNKSWIVLLIDALLGFIFFVNKYFKS